MRADFKKITATVAVSCAVFATTLALAQAEPGNAAPDVYDDSLPAALAVELQAANDMVEIDSGSAVLINVLDNDQGDGLTVRIGTPPAHAEALVSDDSMIEYRPTWSRDESYSGPDSFTYIVTDSTGATAQATVNVKINPVPIVDLYDVPQDGSITITDLLENDWGSGIRLRLSVTKATERMSAH